MDVNGTSAVDQSPVVAALWGVALLVAVALAVPWFLWRSATVVAGLPVWLWWHIGWMVVAAAVFYAFGQRAWGLGIERPTDDANDEVEP
jgi:hypothetical protein